MREKTLRTLILLATLSACGGDLEGASARSATPATSVTASAHAAASSTQTGASSTDAPSASAPATAAPSTAAPAAASASAAAGGSGDDPCLTAAESVQHAKPHRSADPPFADCAAGVFSHCGGGPGERGRLCSSPLDAAATRLARKKKPDACCYGGP